MLARYKLRVDLLEAADLAQSIVVEFLFIHDLSSHHDGHRRLSQARFRASFLSELCLILLLLDLSLSY